MNTLYYILGFPIWWYIGYKSFIYYWTGNRDLTISDRKFGYFLGLSGPITSAAVIIVYFIDNNTNDSKGLKIVAKKRN